MIERGTILCFASGYEAPPTSKHHGVHLLLDVAYDRKHNRGLGREKYDYV